MTTPKVLTAEFIDGIKISETQQLEAAGLDCAEITRRGAHIMLRQVFEIGFFHGDPHPGNLFVLPENVICLLDFGMVGSVTARPGKTLWSWSMLWYTAMKPARLRSCSN